MASRALLFWIALATSAPATFGVEETRNVGHFTGISVSDNIEVHTNVSADGTASSLMLSGAPETLSGVMSSVDAWGTLVLSRTPGGGYSRVVAKAVVPGPLTFAGAAARGTLVADVVSGTVVVASQARVKVGKIDSPRPVSLTTSAHGSLEAGGGRVPHLTVICTAESSMKLGGLRADNATITVSSRSVVEGAAVGSAVVTVSSQSKLSMAATQMVGVSCSMSEVNITGTANVTLFSNWGCNPRAPSAPAAAQPSASAAAQEGSAPPPPPRRLEAAAVLV